jgi:hypothetical protein
MYTPPLLGRAVELHQQALRAEAARDRQTRKAIVGTRTRGGIFLALRDPRLGREQPRPAPPRPAAA